MGWLRAWRQHWRRLGRCDSRMGLTQKTLCEYACAPWPQCVKEDWHGWQNLSHAEALEREEPFSQNDFHPLLVRGLVACLLEAPSTPMEEILFVLPLVKCHNLENLSNNLRAPVS